MEPVCIYFLPNVMVERLPCRYVPWMCHNRAWRWVWITRWTTEAGVSFWGDRGDLRAVFFASGGFSLPRMQKSGWFEALGFTTLFHWKGGISVGTGQNLIPKMNRYIDSQCGGSLDYLDFFDRLIDVEITRWRSEWTLCSRCFRHGISYWYLGWKTWRGWRQMRKCDNLRLV